MDVALTLHADHEFNASTFAARVAVATLADLHAAVVAAIANPQGPAPRRRQRGACFRMLQEIGDPAKAEAFVEQRLGARGALSKGRARGIPGRACRGSATASNPRGRRAGAGATRHGQDDGGSHGRERLFRGGRAGLRCHESAHRPARQRRLLSPRSSTTRSGSPPTSATSIFAIGRVAGWCAHAMEQYADNRLIRPRADYVTAVAPRRLAAAAAREG